MPGSFLVFTLILLSLSLTLALAVYHLRMSTYAGRAQRGAGLLSTIRAESKINEALGKLLQGEIGLKDLVAGQGTGDASGITLRVTRKSRQVYELIATGPWAEVRRSLHAVYVSDFHELRCLPYNLYVEGGEERREGPIYAPSIQISLSRGNLTLVSRHGKEQPVVVSGARIGVAFEAGGEELILRQEGQGLFSGRREMRLRSLATNGDRGGLLMAEHCPLPLDGLTVRSGRQENVAERASEIAILNPVLNQKDSCVFLSASRLRYVLPKPLGGISYAERKFYFLPPEEIEKYEKEKSLSPMAFVDTIGYPATYTVTQDGVFELNAPETLYDFSPQREMWETPNRVRVFSDTKSFMPRGRGIHRVIFQGKDIRFSYDAENRLLELADCGQAEYLARGDGRKTRFRLSREMPISLAFVGGKVCSFDLVKEGTASEIAFATPPGYGEVVQVMSQLPVFQVQKALPRSGTLLLTDKVVMAKRLDLSRLPYRRDVCFTSASPVYLEGATAGDLRLYCDQDVYFGEVKNTRSVLCVEGRLLFFMPQGQGATLGRVVLFTKANEFLSLRGGVQTLRGSFLFRGIYLGSSTEKEVPPIYTLMPYEEKGGRVRLEYDESFITDPFMDLCIYRVL